MLTCVSAHTLPCSAELFALMVCAGRTAKTSAPCSSAATHSVCEQHMGL